MRAIAQRMFSHSNECKGLFERPLKVKSEPSEVVHNVLMEIDLEHDKNVVLPHSALRPLGDVSLQRPLPLLSAEPLSTERESPSNRMCIQPPLRVIRTDASKLKRLSGEPQF